MVGEPAPRHLFIKALLPRSGTQYLARLLALHPLCQVLDEFPNEDWFLRDSQLLIDYFDRLERRYREFGLVEAGCAGEHVGALRARAGDALLSSLGPVRPGARVTVSRTPSIDGLHNVPRLFPGALAIVLVRDGRSACESFHRTFGADPMDAARDWSVAAHRLLALDEETRSRLLVLRYEKLVTDIRGALHEVLEFSGLDSARYPYDDANGLGVYGSSQYLDGDGAGAWRPVARNPSFSPLTRFEHWPESRHRQFNAIAGEAMKALGYTLLFDDDDPA